MDDVLDQVQTLATTLAAHERTIAFRDATRAVEADADASALQQEYAAAIEEVRGREADGRPVEPDAKRALASLGERIRKSPLLQRFLRANLEFNEMMDVVQQTLGGTVERALFPDAAAADHGGHDHAGHSHAPGESCGADAAKPAGDEPKKGPILWTP